MRPVDAHVHVGRWSVPEFQGRAATLAEALQVYLRWNWAGAVVFPTDQAENRELLAAVRATHGPVRFVPGFWADFRQAGNLELFGSTQDSWGILKIHPSCLRVPVTDARLAPYLELAASAGLPVVVHCGRWQEVAGYRLALEAAGRYPQLPFVLAHMGGDSPDLVTAAIGELLSSGRDNVCLGTESIREPWLLESAVEKLGASRLIFGSDYNLNHPEPFRRLVEILDITDRQREQILRDNVCALLPARHRIF
jgi:predicted TIM-barrel fold metal-dependent hydrolase